MAERPTPIRRRGLLAAVYGLTTGLLLYAVAQDLAWVDATLAELAYLIPDKLRPAEVTATAAILAFSLLATIAALGTLWLSHRTGTGFGVLSAATATWAAFPYARVPWARVLGGPTGATYTAPAAVWLLAGILVALATVEICACARENLLAELERRGLPADPGTRAYDATRFELARWLAASLLLGAAIVLAFALVHPIAARFPGSLDLLWAPAIAGLVAGLGIWLWSRR